MEKIQFTYAEKNYTLYQILDLNISDYDKFKSIFSRIYLKDIIFHNESKSIKNFLKLNLDLVMTLYPIYYKNNSKNERLLNTINDIQNTINNPSERALESILLYCKYDSKIPIFLRQRRRTCREDINSNQFKFCILNLIETIIVICRYKEVPSSFNLDRFITAILTINLKNNIKDLNKCDLKNQIRICFQYLEDNFKGNI